MVTVASESTESSESPALEAAFHHHDGGTPEQQWADDPRWDAVTPFTSFGDANLTRLVVVSAHPDDETLGAGGLIALAHRAGLDVEVVVLTDGDASHPVSPTTAPEQLAALRRAETAAAVDRLCPGAGLTFVGLPDGRLDEHLARAVEALVDVVRDAGATTLLVAPWRGDRHPDHEAAGRAAAVAAERTDAQLIEYPIWLWHWATPDLAPWTHMRSLALGVTVRAAKNDAMNHHASQVRPLSAEAGDEVLLHDGMLEHFRREHEVYLAFGRHADDTAFNDLHAGTDDPWNVATSWYERRKRAATLAALPTERHRRALEIGCSIGLLASDLAERCDTLIALDRSAVAVERARRTLVDRPNAAAGQAVIPRDWPTGSFDLVVISEVGYFLSPGELDGLIARVRDSLQPGGSVVLCHWRHPITGWPLDGDDVHDRWRAASETAPVVVHRERDFLLEVYQSPTEEVRARRDEIH